MWPRPLISDKVKIIQIKRGISSYESKKRAIKIFKQGATNADLKGNNRKDGGTLTNVHSSLHADFPFINPWGRLSAAGRSRVSMLSCQHGRVHRERAVWDGQPAPQNSKWQRGGFSCRPLATQPAQAFASHTCEYTATHGQVDKS